MNKMMQKWTLMLLLLSLMLSLGLAVFATETPAYTPGSGDWPFKIDPAKAKQIPGGYALSCTNSVRLPVVLIGAENATVEDVQLKVDSDSARYPFYITGLRVSAIDAKRPVAKDTPVEFDFGTLPIRDVAKDGYYQLDFVIRYRVDNKPEENKPPYEQTISYFAYFHGAGPTQPTKAPESLIATALTEMPRGSFGGRVPLKLNLVNRGTADAQIISVTPVISSDSGTYPFELYYTDYNLPVNRTLRPSQGGQDSEANGSLLVVDFGEQVLRQDVKTGYYKIDFEVTYQVGTAAITKTTVSSYLDAKGKNAGGAAGDKVSTPRLICQGFTTDPATPEGGKPFKLFLKLKNTSQMTLVQNIRLVVNNVGDAEAFLPASGSGTVFIPQIPAGGEQTVELNMIASAKAQQKNYQLSLKMEYEDAKAMNITADESVSILLRQPARVDFGKITLMPQQANLGQDVNVTFPVYNKGKTILYNVSVRVPENQSISGSEVYVGNLEPGASKDVDLMVKTLKIATEQEKPKLVIRYEDENGKEALRDLPISLVIQEPAPLPSQNPAGNEMGAAEAAGSGSLIKTVALISIPVLVLILVVVFVVIRHKRKKAAAMLEDDFD